MNSKVFYFVSITSIALACGFSCADGLGEKTSSLTPWMSYYSSGFKPDWNLVPTVETTYDLFARSMAIPVDAVRNEVDCSLCFDTSEGKVTLFANGVRRIVKPDGSCEYFEQTSSAMCAVSAAGEVQAKHLDALQQNSCSVSIEDGGPVFKSNKVISDAQTRLNLMIRLRDGLSVVFEYCDNDTIIARESTGCVEVICSSSKIVSSILQSHGMIKPPEGAACVAEGLVCNDGDGITCYVMNGMKFHAASNGLKFCFSAPALQVQLEGLVSHDHILSRWKFCSPTTQQFKKCCYDGTDILFDKESGRSLLYVNLTTIQSGFFLYDEKGNYCKCSGIGGVRYGKVSPLLMYDTVSAAVAKISSPGMVRSIPQQFLSRAAAAVA